MFNKQKAIVVECFYSSFLLLLLLEGLVLFDIFIIGGGKVESDIVGEFKTGKCR